MLLIILLTSSRRHHNSNWSLRNFDDGRNLQTISGLHSVARISPADCCKALKTSPRLLRSVGNNRYVSSYKRTFTVIYSGFNTAKLLCIRCVGSLRSTTNYGINEYEWTNGKTPASTSQMLRKLQLMKNWLPGICFCGFMLNFQAIWKKVKETVGKGKSMKSSVAFPDLRCRPTQCLQSILPA